MIYDIIIIGGGISGLYSAYKLEQISPDTTYLILEKNKILGGRAHNDIFYNTNIVTGAGIGRNKKDKLLLKLIKDLNLSTNEFAIDYTYSKLIDKPVNIISIMKTLKNKLNNNYLHMTFKEYFIKIFDKNLYNKFKITSGYTDYENEDVYDVLYHYGMDDNYCCNIGNTIPWNDIIISLSNIIGINNIKLLEEVTKIINNNNKYIIKCKNNNIYYTNKIIFASTIDTIIKLLPEYKIYKEIHAQIFLRVYGKFSKMSIPIIKDYIKNTIIVPNELQKIIPIDSNKGIYMIAYCDNNNAKKLHKYLDNTMTNRNIFCKLIMESIGIDKSEKIKLIAIKSFYWNIGTHYYEPLSNDYKNRIEYIHKAQHPEKNIIVVGEMISLHQGWTEGALESIEKVLTKKFVNK